MGPLGLGSSSTSNRSNDIVLCGVGGVCGGLGLNDGGYEGVLWVNIGLGFAKIGAPLTGPIRPVPLPPPPLPLGCVPPNLKSSLGGMYSSWVTSSSSNGGGLEFCPSVRAGETCVTLDDRNRMKTECICKFLEAKDKFRKLTFKWKFNGWIWI
ncbi:hypothetical protein ACFE04_006448 [Oxalis oulophora]